MDDAAFSGHIQAVLDKAAITGAFTVIRRRQVNVLREDEFPLLAVWVEDDGEADVAGSDDEFQYEAEYTFLVAARLGDGDAQDVKIGQLIKAARDAIDAMTESGVEYSVGRWHADNGTAENEGDKVWAEFPVTIRYYRPRGDY